MLLFKTENFGFVMLSINSNKTKNTFLCSLTVEIFTLINNQIQFCMKQKII